MNINKEAIIKEIKSAELQTSGEIKVHIEEVCPVDDPVERAKQVFDYLALDRTAQRNGVLFYLALSNRKFAILGDTGIDQVVTSVFWESTKETLKSYFVKGMITEGLCEGIRMAGNQLQKYFPYQKDDVNEISDDISTDPIP